MRRLMRFEKIHKPNGRPECVNYVTFFQNFVTHSEETFRNFVSDIRRTTIEVLPYSQDPVRAELTGINRMIDASQASWRTRSMLHPTSCPFVFY